jgi:hypothetical protein
VRDVLRNSGLIVLVIGLGVIGLIAAWLLARRSSASRKPRQLLDYVLVWPLLFDRERERDSQRAGRLFTKRELIGWGVVVALIILAVIFTGRE